MTEPPIHFRTRMKIRQLLLLAHLDRERSVLGAAQATGMTQPAASKLLKDLEDDLGVVLFVRHPKGVVPTEYGDILIRHAHSILSEIGRAQAGIAALKRGDHYRVTIGSVMSPCTHLLPNALAALEQTHPKMLVKVEVDNSRPLVKKLLEGRLDMVIGRVLDAEHAPDLLVEPLTEESHSLIGRYGHPLSGRARLEFEDLVGYTWIWPPFDSILRERINAMFLQRGLELPAKVIETSSVPLVTNLLQNTDRLVALPQEVVAPYCKAGLLCVLPIDLGIRLDAYGIITRRHHELHPDAQKALEALRHRARALYAD